MPVKLFLSEEGLRAFHELGFFGAAIVGVAFLDFRRDHSSAFAAAQKAGEDLRFALDGEVVRALFQHFLHFVEQGFGNDRRMLSLIQFTGIFKMAVVKGIPEHPANAVMADFHAPFGSAVLLFGHNAVLGQEILHVVEGAVSFGVCLKGALHDGRKGRINNDGFCGLVIDISARSHAGVYAHARLLLQSTGGIVCELVAVLLGLDELMAEIRFALGRVLEPEGGELEVGELSGIEEVDDLAAVHAVAGKPVGMPGDDA